MKVKEFINLGGGSWYQLVDATRGGYMTSPHILIEADRNVVSERYGDKEIVHIEAIKKGTIRLFVK